MIPGDLENTTTATIIPCIDYLSFIPYLLWCTCRSSLCSVALPGLLDQWHCAVECRQELGGCVWGRRSPEVNSELGAPCGLPQHVEKKFRPEADVQSDELLGLEYLFRLSTGESRAFSIDGLVKDGPVGWFVSARSGWPLAPGTTGFHFVLLLGTTGFIYPGILIFWQSLTKNNFEKIIKHKNFC